MSDYRRNIQVIINTFAWVSVLIVFMLISYWAVSVAELATATYEVPLGTLRRITGSNSIIVAVFMLTSIIGIYVLRGMWGLTAYYRERLRFQRRLFAAVQRQSATWHFIEVWKLIAMRIITLLPFVALGILIVIFVLGSLAVTFLPRHPLGP